VLLRWRPPIGVRVANPAQLGTRVLGVSVTGSDAGAMVMSLSIENGEQRIYMSRFASVVTYFTSDEESGGVVLHVEPGHLAFASEFDRNAGLVREAVLVEVAGRLGVDTVQLLAVPFEQIKELADPPLPEHYRYARRSQNRAFPHRR